MINLEGSFLVRYTFFSFPPCIRLMEGQLTWSWWKVVWMEFWEKVQPPELKVRV